MLMKMLSKDNQAQNYNQNLAYKFSKGGIRIESNEIIIKESNGIKYMQFKRLLQYKNIVHCYTLKENLNFRGASPIKQDSIENICNVLKLDNEKFIMAEQEHTKNIAIINIIMIIR